MFDLKKFLLDNKTIELQQTAANWKQAIKLGVRPLVNKGFVNESYYQAIIDSYNTYGPYFVISPGLAIAHARPDSGVTQNCLSLLTLRAPVCFHCDNDPVTTIFTIAAVDNKTMNKKIMLPLFDILSDKKRLNRLTEAKNYTELSAIL